VTSELKNLTDGQLKLVPATRAMLKAELAGNHTQIYSRLNVSLPPCWPPELNDADSYVHFLYVLKTVPTAAGWGAHYAVNMQKVSTLVGTDGFVMPPDADGIVEIGYRILKPYRKQGMATCLARLLVEHAFAYNRVKCVIATTYPHLIASIGLLTKLGFAYDGEHEDGIIAYRLAR